MRNEEDLLMLIAGEFKSAVDCEKAVNRSKALTAITEQLMLSPASKISVRRSADCINCNCPKDVEDRKIGRAHV